MSHPDLLNLPPHQRESLARNGHCDGKEETQGPSSRGVSPMHCDTCGTRLLLVHIVPRPTKEHPRQWNGRFWCLNAECDSFCEDVLLTVE